MFCFWEEEAENGGHMREKMGQAEKDWRREWHKQGAPGKGGSQRVYFTLKPADIQMTPR